MGKSVPSPISFQDFARIVASNTPRIEYILRKQKSAMKLKSQIKKLDELKSQFSESPKPVPVIRIEEPPVKLLRQTVEDVSRFQKKKLMDVKCESSESAKPKHVTRIKPPKEPPVKPLRPTEEDLLSLRNKKKIMMEVKSKSYKSEEEEKSRSKNDRMPLAEVVSDCVNRWFEDTLKEAEAGDTVMQMLVAQMYYKGYGVTKDIFKGWLWLNEASGTVHTPSEVPYFIDKQPGYNASDSDSD